MKPATINWLHVALLVAFIATSVAASPHLPNQIPLHYGFNGQLDATAGKSSGAWYILPVAAITMALVFRGFAALAREPHTWKFSDEELKLFRMLPDAERAEMIESAQKNLLLISVAVTVVMVSLQFGNYVVATRNASALPAATWGAVIASIVFMLVVSVRHERAQKKRLRSSGFGSPGSPRT